MRAVLKNQNLAASGYVDVNLPQGFGSVVRLHVAVAGPVTGSVVFSLQALDPNASASLLGTAVSSSSVTGATTLSLLLQNTYSSSVRVSWTVVTGPINGVSATVFYPGAEMKYDTEEGIYRLAVEGKVAVQVPPPPPGGVKKQFSQNDVNLDVASTHDTTYTITNGKTFVIQQIVVGAEGDPNEKGSKVEIIYNNGTQHLVDRIYITGMSLFGNYPDTSSARDGTALVGNGSHTLILRRTRLGGAALEIDCVVRGYEI